MNGMFGNEGELGPPRIRRCESLQGGGFGAVVSETREAARPYPGEPLRAEEQEQD
jgi:hypothetical protein